MGDSVRMQMNGNGTSCRPVAVLGMFHGTHEILNGQQA